MLNSPTGWQNVSPLEVLISRACEPSLHEPNYAIHVEVADYINAKKANTPREAAMNIARLANNRNPHISILALALLETLVQSCGYPFHLQISTKEFLNELVRRFPERPPPFPGPVMSRILELIHGWKEGICTSSRWKEDLGNIRDMHRLLTFKGYRFRDNTRSQQQSLTTSASNLKTAEELENEDRDAQSAKLQELIRRGTPRDLAAAQELMKSLAGANPDAKPDYRSQALTELNKLEQKVILLNEMLDNVDTERGERFVSGDAYDQVANILTSARPKIQKWISEAESHDSESLDTFLQINDQINTVVNRYEAYKKGDYSFAANPIPAELAPGGGGDSLIDFDAQSPPTTSHPANDANDLSGLFAAAAPITPSPPLHQQHHPQFHQTVPMMGANLNMNMGMAGMGAGPSIPTHSPAPLPFNTNGGGWGLKPSMTPPHPGSTATPPASIMLPTTPAFGGAPPNYANLNMTGLAGTPHTQVPMGLGPGMINMGGGMGLGVATQSPHPSQGTPQLQPRAPAQTAPSPPQQTQQGKDPFADLAGLF